MKQSDLYWSVYKNLEDEVIDVARYIHCDSVQKQVYSMIIADLIVRCAVEIEAISKKIYQNLGGKMKIHDENGVERYPYFDRDCLSLIDKTYHIAKKKVVISSSLFFLNEKDRVLIPLKESHKMGKGKGCKWKDAYQSLKHDRYESLKQYGTIYNLLHAVAALYVLNIYLRDEVYDLPNGLFDERIDSKLFSVIVYKADHLAVNAKRMSDASIIPVSENVNKDEALFIVKLHESDFKSLFTAIVEENRQSFQKICNSQSIQNYILNNPNYHIKNPISLIIDAEGPDALNKYINPLKTVKYLQVKRREAVVNKCQPIYPDLIEKELN